MSNARGIEGALYLLTESTPGVYLAPTPATDVALHCVERPTFKEGENTIQFRDDEWSKTQHGPDEILPGSRRWIVSGSSYLRRASDASDRTSHSLAALLAACPLAVTEAGTADGDLVYAPTDRHLIGTSPRPLSATLYDGPTGDVRAARGVVAVITKIHAAGTDKPIMVDWEASGLWSSDRAKHAVDFANVVEDTTEPIYHRDCTITHGISGSAGAIDFGGFEFSTGMKLDPFASATGVHGHRYAYVRHVGRPELKWYANAVDESASGFQAFAQAMNPAGHVAFSMAWAVDGDTVATLSMPRARYALPEDTDTEGRATLALTVRGGGLARNSQYSLSLTGPQ